MFGSEPLECRLAESTLADIEILKKWFKTAAEVSSWGGPHMHFPFEQAQFLKDILFNSMMSYSLFQNDEMVAFGQCYDRQGRCHLGRLVVAPEHRRYGFGAILIEQLVAIGCQTLQLDSASLFVLKNNIPAKNLYIKLGFVEQTYPVNDIDMDLSEIDYLVKNTWRT